MFDGTVLLYGIVSAMMIGKDKTFGRYDFTGTASAENDDGIFHRCTVGIVNIIDVDKQTGFFQLFAILLFEKREKPHTLVSHRRRDGNGGSEQSC